ncbi:MAG: hypothetical protein A2042_01595, partial [Candidatus Schekmanbacteria bacterium GWA2_38_11]
MDSIKTILLERQKINDAIRSFFRERNYVEVETPLLVSSPGMESNLMPFETIVIDDQGKKYPGAFITSPEYSMKKILGSGLERIFTITKVFRNGEELGGTHEPEFSMLEWYSQGMNYKNGMDETELLVRAIAKIFGKILPVFRRLCLRDLFQEKIGMDLDHAISTDLAHACDQHDIHRDETDTESDLFYRLFLTLVEPFLGSDPVFIYDYPVYQAALSCLTPDGHYGQRFELYIDGLELCNGFTELTDAEEQRKRFQEEA